MWKGSIEIEHSLKCPMTVSFGIQFGRTQMGLISQIPSGLPCHTIYHRTPMVNPQSMSDGEWEQQTRPDTSAAGISMM